MSTQRLFLRGIITLSAVAFSFFTAEFIFEWIRMGSPGLEQVSYADKNNNVKMIDVLSPMARAYNNILAMLIATVGLAIPLTANMHTPKLIDMFLRDRINQLMLIFGALGAAHVLWVAYMIGPDFAPVWSYRLAVLGALVGWVFLIPYFFYVVRFLDPSNILARLKERVVKDVNRVQESTQNLFATHDQIRDQILQIGTLIMKSIDRGDRSVAAEGIWSFKQILDHYRKLKPHMPENWFHVERRDLVGLSAEALEILNQDRTWFEHRVMWQMYLAYENALAKAHDVVSSLSDATRVIAIRSSAAGDEKAMDLTIKFFNNFIREGIKKKDAHAVYDLMYQYRMLACDLCDRPDVLEKIGRYMVHYSQIALATGMAFVTQLVAFDLGVVVMQAFARKSPAAPNLLACLLELKHRAGVDPVPLIVKAKAIVGASLAADPQGSASAEQVRENLSDLPEETLHQVEQDLMKLDDRSFWEVTDRQVNFEWVPPERRPAVQQFLATVRASRLSHQVDHVLAPTKA